MKVSYLFILIFFFVSCKSYKGYDFAYRNEDTNTWINTFKAEVFYSCIKEGLKNDSLNIILKKKDLLNLYEGMDFEDIDTARLLGKRIIDEMPKANIKIDNDEPDLKTKNFISCSCLQFYASRNLDSIARKILKSKMKKK